MPSLKVEQFDQPPSIGDTVTITGKVQQIKNGNVEVSYDSIVTLPGNSEGNPEVSLDESLNKFMSDQKKQEDNTATQ